MSSPAWMPLYVADYISDTGHLTAAQHGAYLLLIMHYWRTGGLPTDDGSLSRIARMSPEEWDSNRIAIASFFTSTWGHKRIDKELSEAKKTWEKRRSAGSAGAKSRWNKRKPDNGNRIAIASKSQWQNDGQSQSQSQSPILDSVAKATAAPPQPNPLKTQSFETARSLGINGGAVGKAAQLCGNDWGAVSEVLGRCRLHRPANPTSWFLAEFQAHGRDPPRKTKLREALEQAQRDGRLPNGDGRAG